MSFISIYRCVTGVSEGTSDGWAVFGYYRYITIYEFYFTEAPPPVLRTVLRYNLEYG